MLTYIFYYLSIGVLFNFLFDKLIDFIEDEDNRFNNFERVYTALLWPVALLVFLYHLIKTLLGK